jgi:hypothetical protein
MLIRAPQKDLVLQKLLVMEDVETMAAYLQAQKLLEGRKRIADATRKRMINGQKYKAQEGFKRWIAAGGRDFLSQIMIVRWRRRKCVLEAF